MKHTNYFCGICYKTFAEYWNGQIFCDKEGNPYPKNSPLITGKCDNVIKGTICGGKLQID